MNTKKSLDEQISEAQEKYNKAHSTLHRLRCKKLYKSVFCIRDLIALHKEMTPDSHWFNAETMRYFKTRIYRRVYGRNIFITSEKKSFSDNSRAYTVRQLSPDGQIKSLSEFLAYPTLARAKTAAIKFSRQEETK